MIVLGLTGSIGMGKSTTAEMFRDMDIPVHDADASVHALYETVLVGPVEDAFPGTVVNGSVNRAQLSSRVVGDDEAMKKLEAIVHPAVRQMEESFLKSEPVVSAPLVVLDIPLLYETGGAERVDKVVVVSASPETQRNRVITREGMTEEKFKKILGLQLPDKEKRARADFIIDTDKGFEAARTQVAEIVRTLTR